MADEGADTALDDTSGGDDFYDLLGVPRSASAADIKSAFRTRARTWHPDAGGDSAQFALLREAYETLSDPALRAAYDERGTRAVREHPDPEDRGPAPPEPTRPGRARARARAFGDDPSFRPPRVRVDPTTIPWWDAAVRDPRPRLSPAAAPGHAGPAACLGAAVLVLVALLVADLPTPAVAGGLVLVVGALGLTGTLIRRRREKVRAVRAEVGDVVFGTPGSEDDQIAERRTADLLGRYLTRLPGARIFHGLAWPGSVFADIDHAVLCGHRLLLVESKRWLPGHYSTVDDPSGDAVLYRNGRRFGGGGSRLADALEVFEDLLPDVEVRGALVLYPNRAGAITVDTASSGDTDVRVLTPEQFVRDAGAWLAEDPSTVDINAFRTVLAQVVS